jgi:hypothetical protein
MKELEKEKITVFNKYGMKTFEGEVSIEDKELVKILNRRNKLSLVIRNETRT